MSRFEPNAPRRFRLFLRVFVITTFLAQIPLCRCSVRKARTLSIKHRAYFKRLHSADVQTHTFVLHKACRRKCCLDNAKVQLQKNGCSAVSIFTELRIIKARCEQTSQLRKLRSTPRFFSVHPTNSISITLKRIPIHSERHLSISMQTIVKQDEPKLSAHIEMLATENTGERAKRAAILEPEPLHGWEGLAKRVPYNAPTNTTCYPRRGANVNVFVIDTGCRVTHEQLRRRAVSYPIAGSPFTSGDDEVGHGTHIAATIVGRDLGLATSSRVVCVKAMSGRNSGSSANIISAIDHVIEVTERYRRSNRTLRAVILSISLGVQAPVDYTALDNAVTRAAMAGIVPIVAAGNGGHDACTFTPARAAGAISVAALTENNHLAPFSNRGTCVAVAARGDSVASAYHKSDSGYALGTGTSIAVPLVSTMAALILGEKAFLKPAQVLRELTKGHETAHGIPIASLPACS
jgi:hypothetical protein